MKKNDTFFGIFILFAVIGGSMIALLMATFEIYFLEKDLKIAHEEIDKFFEYPQETSINMSNIALENKYQECTEELNYCWRTFSKCPSCPIQKVDNFEEYHTCKQEKQELLIERDNLLKSRDDLKSIIDICDKERAYYKTLMCGF